MTQGEAGVRAGTGIKVEIALAGVVLVALLACLGRALGLGYLPAPFFYDPRDTFMDWYYVAYWGHHAGDAYGIERTIYPPFSLVFTNLFGDPHCFSQDPVLARNCDILGKVAIFASYFASLFVVFRSFWLNAPRTALNRTAAMGLGFPMLCALDLGNLVVPAFLCFAIGQGGLVRSARWQWLAIASSINFKPYLVVTLLPRILRRHWSWLAGCTAAVLAVYLVSYVVLGSGAPLQILLDDYMWSTGKFRDVYASFYAGSSYTSMLSLFDYSPSIYSFFGAAKFDAIRIAAVASLRAGQAGVVLLLVAVAMGRLRAPRHRMAALCFSLALVSVELDVYSALFLLFLVFLEEWREPGAIVAIVAAYLLCIPADAPIAVLDHWRVFSYLGNRMVTVPLGLNIGSLVRPGLILVIQYGLIAATVGEALKRRHAMAERQAVAAA